MPTTPAFRDSASHPLRIDAVSTPGGGLLGLTLCPGKRDAAAQTGAWRRDLDLDLDAIRAWGASTVVTLVRPEELELLAVQGLGAAVAARGMAWHHMPITDVSVPDAAFERAWGLVGAELRGRLRRGERILVHCRGGLGRSGLVAARLLVELGVPAETAIRQVRAARPGAIETFAQEAHVRKIVRLDEEMKIMAGAPGFAERVRGCFLAGACGDALGGPVEFLRRSEILRRYGPDGIAGFDRAYGRMGAITDDTQMTLFTAEGLIRAWVGGALQGICHPPGVVHHAYLRWLLTQGSAPDGGLEVGRDGWLFQEKALHSRRAPGHTCLSALEAARSLGEPVPNDSKGCGGVMRVAPVGFLGRDLDIEAMFTLAADIARLTHGHPSGYLASGALAAVLGVAVDGGKLQEGLDAALAILKRHARHDETSAILEAARREATTGSADTVPTRLGQGWVAEEALAIAVWAVLVEPDPVRAVRLAVNHDGDSDSTGSIAGQILGTLHGPGWLPAEWLERLELRAGIERLAEDFARVFDPAGKAPDVEAMRDDYPGW